MTSPFSDEVVDAILGHMNGHHTDDNTLIVRAFVDPTVASATMAGFDGDGGEWEAVQADGAVRRVRVAWPDAPITERGEVRREVVKLYDGACAELGVTPRPH